MHPKYLVFEIARREYWRKSITESLNYWKEIWRRNFYSMLGFAKTLTSDKVVFKLPKT